MRQLSKDKWDFDSSRDVILSFKFAHEQYLILSTNEYFKMLKYKDKIRSTFSYGKLLVASLLSETPNLTLSELKRRLLEYGTSLSKTSLSKMGLCRIVTMKRAKNVEGDCLNGISRNISVLMTYL